MHVCVHVCVSVCVSVSEQVRCSKHIPDIRHSQSMQGQEILKMIEAGHRMSAPKDCPPDLYEVMLSCWKYR